MDSQTFYALRYDIQDKDLTLDGIVDLIYRIAEKVGHKPAYLFMAESDIAVLATDASLGYIKGVSNTIMSAFLVPLPGLEHGAIIAGFFR